MQEVVVDVGTSEIRISILGAYRYEVCYRYDNRTWSVAT
jgi:hypothetical protein